MNYHCCTDNRRNAVKDHPLLNGIDYLEVMDNKSDPFSERQKTLFLYFLKPVPPASIEPINVRIEGGERIKNIIVTEVLTYEEYLFPVSPAQNSDHILVLRVSLAGDFSTYTLRLIQDKDNLIAPENIDPILSSVDFSFKVACPTDFDCEPVVICPPVAMTSPQINYLAKDFESFRQLMLDRMALLVPEWKERNPADLGIALVELLAYTADYLSYRQDAIGTEAYLGTARKRKSVRRHARLVDYFMHDGCNARSWLHIQVGPNVNGLLLEKGEGASTTKVISQIEGLPPAIRMDSVEFEDALKSGVQVFELMHDLSLYTNHNTFQFYTWGANECCLPKGATQATLIGKFPHLKKGDILVLSEVLGPKTGHPADANPTHRHAIRLTEVLIKQDIDFSADSSSTEITYLDITEISWDKMDALPFPLCISGQGGLENISIAMGNIVLVDHGITIQDEKESSVSPYLVPKSNMIFGTHTQKNGDRCSENQPISIPARYQPRLLAGPLTFAAPLDLQKESLTAMNGMNWKTSDAMPEIVLQETGTEGDLKGNPEWIPQRDLLSSTANAKEFVVEVESDGVPHIRFGNNQHGARPPTETEFIARYRIGNGKSGNVGSKTLSHLVTLDASIISSMPDTAKVWNPLPAKGGEEAETMEEVRQYAPEAFRTQERAVTSADYELFAKKCDPDVQNAAATLRWTGSWNTVFLTVDRLEGLLVDDEFEAGLRNCLEQYRMAGFDLEVDTPLYVSLEIGISVCVGVNFFRSDVKQELLNVFSNRILSNGQSGVFHPDNFSFGQSVYLSQLYAAAQSVQGVDSVRISTFQRQGTPSVEAIESGVLEFGRREIARLNNDPNFPNHGVFTLNMQGGRA